MSLLLLIIMNKLHASVLSRHYIPGLRAPTFQHSCSLLPRGYFVSGLGQGEFPTDLSVVADLYFVSVLDPLYPSPFNSTLFSRFFSGSKDGRKLLWVSFLTFLRNRYIYIITFHISEDPFLGSRCWKCCCPSPSGLRIFCIWDLNLGTRWIICNLLPAVTNHYLNTHTWVSHRGLHHAWNPAPTLQ